MKELFPLKTYFVSGIDTDAGKTVATGFISRTLREEGVNVITQKLIQTGNHGISEDIAMHRKIEDRALLPEDIDETTCCLIYSYPCSPHMAIAIDGRAPEYDKATANTHLLEQKYDKVLVEGAGGLMVPLTEDYLNIDYIADQGLPCILVGTAKLGSINHILLSMEALGHRGIPTPALLYNRGVATDERITAETERYLRGYLQRHYPETSFIPLPILDL